MVISPDMMRIFLAACVIGMALLGGLYLCQRVLPRSDYLRWGLLLILVPVLGPFLVILSRPGKPAR